MSANKALGDVDLGEAVAVGSDLYNQVLQHYYNEALLLDHIRLQEWGATLAEDLRYSVPVRQTRTVRDSAESVVRSVMHMDDDCDALWRMMQGVYVL